MTGFIEKQEKRSRIFHKMLIAWLIIGTCGIGLGMIFLMGCFLIERMP